MGLTDNWESPKILTDYWLLIIDIIDIEKYWQSPRKKSLVIENCMGSPILAILLISQFSPIVAITFLWTAMLQATRQILYWENNFITIKMFCC